MTTVVNHTAEEESALKRVVQAIESAKSTHEAFKRRSEHFYRLYRSYQGTPTAAMPWKAGADRGLVYDARREWGAELFIPYVFSTIETIVPRAVSQRPRMLVLPRDEESEGNHDNMRLTIDAQQEQIDYDLVLEDVLRTGLIRGLGVQKEVWNTEYIPRRRVKRRMLPAEMLGRAAYKMGRVEWECIFDDPVAEWVDPDDFFWDPYSDSIDLPNSRRAEWVGHRMWFSHERCMERLKAYGDRPAAWNTEAAQQLTEDKLRSIANGGEYDAIRNERLIAAGMGADGKVSSSGRHEVIEFHDGKRVITVLDRVVLVVDAESPTLGRIPFQVYRPTKVAGEMVGIGEVEPIEHLQLELNTLRSQRRDNATLKLMGSYAFDDSVVDQDDIVFGPGITIPVNGNPRDAIKELTVGDIPNSGYQEEAALVNDIHRTSGIDDTVSGADGSAGGASSTATGVQLVQAAANQRIARKARRLEVEVIRGAARVFGRLNQRKIMEERTRRVQQEPHPSDPNTKRWTWFKIGPAELRGEFDYIPEGGSTQPENTPQMRQDAQMLWQLFRDNEGIDQGELMKIVLEKLGIKHPDSLIVQGQQGIPPGVLDRLLAAGVPKDWIERAVAMEQQVDPAGGQIEAPQEAVAA